MREEHLIVAPGALPARGPAPDPDLLHLLREQCAQVHLARAGRRPPREAFEYVAPYLIAATANRGPEVHHELGDGDSLNRECAKSLCENPPGDAAPARMHDRDHARRMRDENWDAVGDGHRRRSARGKKVPVGPVGTHPATPTGAMDEYARAMHLPRRREPGGPQWNKSNLEGVPTGRGFRICTLLRETE